jgi:hypothetical protein
MSYEDWRAVPFDQVLRRQIADLDAWTSKSRHLPALCLSPASRQKKHRCGGVIVPVWSSETSAVAHCVYEYKNPANTKTGQRSQEITYDFIQAEAGIYRRAQTIPGHRYQVEAWGKHVRSQSPVELSLGVDLIGGKNWQAATVVWHPWDETEEEVWVHTQIVVRASGESLTVFLKGHHPFAVQGGATLFDDVQVVDLGP